VEIAGRSAHADPGHAFDLLPVDPGGPAKPRVCFSQATVNQFSPLSRALIALLGGSSPDRDVFFHLSAEELNPTVATLELTAWHEDRKYQRVLAHCHATVNGSNGLGYRTKPIK